MINRKIYTELKKILTLGNDEKEVKCLIYVSGFNANVKNLEDFGIKIEEKFPFINAISAKVPVELINKLSKDLNLTIIMVLHDLNLAVLYSDYIAVIDLHTLALMTEADKFITNENLRLYFNLNSVIITDGLYMIAKKVHNEN